MQTDATPTTVRPFATIAEARRLLEEAADAAERGSRLLCEGSDDVLDLDDDDTRGAMLAVFRIRDAVAPE